MEVNETHNKIIEVLKDRGPSLPIQIAKQIGLSSLFVSAFLSELADEKKVKISNLKVGGSPLYFLSGQEQLLVPFHKFLHPKEIEAFLLLKQKKILKDSEQNPAVRVALRSIKDFAIGFKQQDEIFWRYSLVSEFEIMQTIAPEPIQKRKSPMQQTKPQILKPEKKIPETKISRPKTKEKSKSEFVLKAIEFLNKNHKIIEEKDFKNKEYNCVIQVSSDLGDINFLVQAKDKKTISESDLMKLLSNAKSKSLPALILHIGKLGKRAEEYLNSHSSILKAKKIDGEEQKNLKTSN